MVVNALLLISGRIDRKIEFPLPDEKTKKRIFQIHTSRMTLAEDVTLDDLILAKDDLSGADIKVCEWVCGCVSAPSDREQYTDQWCIQITVCAAVWSGSSVLTLKLIIFL